VIASVRKDVASAAVSESSKCRRRPGVALRERRAGVVDLADMIQFSAAADASAILRASCETAARFNCDIDIQRNPLDGRRGAEAR